jgi:transketolase
MNVDSSNPEWEERDRFILSKGHCALAYVPCLAMKGFVPMESLDSFNKFRSAYGMHPDSKKIRGCDASTGSLGHGMPMAVGMSLGLTLKGNLKSKVVCMIGDGELAEGSNWEAFMAGAKYQLKNLICIIDRNKMEIDGLTEEIMPLEPIDKKLEAFNWKVLKCNGNDMDDVDKCLATAWNTPGPVFIISDTVKGFGLSEFAGKVTSHYGAIDSDMLERALKDIDAMK